ncbi:MAG: LuxR C-terminal-related transcriptional regulator [Defluviitaleaceae bacterium]|nr:LuxR C-terminal-related transcriptional regulator [Defluviitaleaceae bacterium]
MSTIESSLKSPQQKQVLEYMKLDYPQKKMAEKMNISEARVSQHAKRISEIAKTEYPNGLSEIL